MHVEPLPKYFNKPLNCLFLHEFLNFEILSFVGLPLILDYNESRRDEIRSVFSMCIKMGHCELVECLQPSVTQSIGALKGEEITETEVCSDLKFTAGSNLID